MASTLSLSLPGLTASPTMTAAPSPSSVRRAMSPLSREPAVTTPALSAPLPSSALDLPLPETAFRDMPLAEALAHVMALIHTPASGLSAPRAKRVMADVLDAWSAHVNPGFLLYRKSVAEGGSFAAIEWADDKSDPHGCSVLDAEGHSYLDALSGFGIFNTGHSHPTIVAAVQAQLLRMPLHSQELLDPLRAYAASLLARSMPVGSPLQYSFFTNSGTESVEHALKFAMLATGRTKFVALIGGFHGKTLGSLSGTSKSVFRAPFKSALLPFTHVPPNDCAALRGAFAAAAFTGDAPAGLLLEPILGEGGIHVLSDAFLRLARELCDAAGAMLILDEVQSGMGRSGRMWAHEHAGIHPDIMAVGKAFGGGVMPAGAVIASATVWARFIEEPFLTTTTFGGCPLAMAAACAALSVTLSCGLPAAAEARGGRLLSGLRTLAAAHPQLIAEVRGRGMMIGLQFVDHATGYAFAKACFARRVIVSGTLINSQTIRVEPPLTMSHAQAEELLARFSAALEAVAAEHLAASAGDSCASPQGGAGAGATQH